MGMKRRFAVAMVATMLLGGVCQGLAQPLTSDAGPRAERDPLTWELPFEIHGSRVFVLEIELVESDALDEFLGKPSTRRVQSDSMRRGTDRESVFWQSIADSDNPAVFEAYLEQWSDGTFVRLAEIRLEELRTPSRADTRPVPPSADDSHATEELLKLLRHELSTRDENGWTLLHYAAVLDLPDLVDQLLDEGTPGDRSGRPFAPWMGGVAVDVDARLEDDGRPLTGPLRRALRRLSLDFDEWTRDGETALHLAASANARGAVMELLIGGADVHAKTALDWTPLHYAAWTDAEDVVKVLLAEGADVNARASGGWTSLHVAVWSDSRAAVSALLVRGADLTAMTNAGEAASDLAKSGEMRVLLRGTRG